MTENLKHSLDTTPESSQRPLKISKTEENQNNKNSNNREEEGQEKEETRIAKPMSQNPRLQRYLIAIEYLGTRFSGSQKQLNCRTVVGVLEEAFHKFIGQPVSVSISSRTDAGVHALSNVCHVDVERISKRKPGEVLPPHEPTVVKKAVNHFLQGEGDIMVTDVRFIPSDFHARFEAQERTYFYRLLSGPEPLSIFDKDRAWHVPEELDLHAMQEACKFLVGCHDFSSFRASGCQANSPIRTIDELHIYEVIATPYFQSNMEREQNNVKEEDFCPVDSNSATYLPMSSISYSNMLGASNGGSNVEFGIRRRHHNYVVKVRARSFLYHQDGCALEMSIPSILVRLIVGVLKSVGTGDITVPDVERILNAKTVTAASAMAPACGLYLGQVKYNLSQNN